MMQENKKIRLNVSSIIAAVRKIRQLQKEYIGVLVVQAVLQSLKPFIPIILSAKILDELLGGKDINRLILLISLLVGLTLADHILLAFYTKKYNDKNRMLINNYFFELSKKCMKMSYAEAEKPQTRDLLQLIEEAGHNYMGIWNIAEYMQKGALALLEILIALVLICTVFSGGGIEIADQSLQFIESTAAAAGLIFLLLAGLGIYSLVQSRIGKTAANNAKNGVKSNRTFGYLFFHISYNYENGKDIRLYNAQNMLGEKIKYYVDDSCNEVEENYVRPNIKHFSILNLVNVLLLIAVYTFIILKAYVGAITVGAIFIQINAIMRLYQALGSLMKQYNMLIVSCEHFKNSIKFFDLPEMKKQGAEKINGADGNRYIFEFKNVSFKYPSTDNLVLDKINLQIKKGERLAVVGMNGAGKTTMVKLLCRLYDPSEGTITLNGIDIKEYDYDEYIKMFSVVFQDFKLFSFELDQNIAVSEKPDPVRLQECIINAGLKNIADELKGDYKVCMDKNFDEHGRDFSGGERQKTAIARALYKDAPVVVLDEPTAALDPITEYEIYSKLDTLVGSKAAVFISHRLSSCRFCHSIAVFDKGRIVQLGSHEKLVQDKDGKYYELWDAQAKHYAEPSEEERALL
ncbi:MAG: ABC transporter ATP-binding protein [Clostridia bacterium]|nr:ABC transporter ATP-binding protein [Clostridia bacterium]